DRAHQIVRQTISNSECLEPPTLELIQAIGSADPERSLIVSEKRKHDVARKPILRRVACELAVFERVQASTLSSNPDSTRLVLEDRFDQIVRQSLLGRECRELLVAEQIQSA